MSVKTPNYDKKIAALLAQVEDLKEKRSKREHLLDLAPEIIDLLDSSEARYEGTGDEILKQLIASVERLREIKREERSERAKAAAARRAEKKDKERADDYPTQDDMEPQTASDSTDGDNVDSNGSDAPVPWGGFMSN
ncbi:hypothetical protein GFD17_02685 [Bifidobacterium sp. SMB2]|uniref:Uncharacterized protein n=1 Tax=Bifidobacterium saimiriisciurei TaxID=2661627 RepID=A0ABX0CER6_9BIFI|nr:MULTISPECIES: hypothetical protein [Bifidobacterium]NEG95676.1 hypothetical protein [Bifidobacterium sp. SMB2]NEH11103.1 hypothetical protein [Bifidobacterium saimiriisciurei]